MSDCSNWRGDRIKATVEREFRERRSGDSGAWSVTRERQPERTQRVIAETTERVDVPRTRRVRTCLSLSRKAIKSPESPRANLVRFLPLYEHCYSGCRNPRRKPERRRRHVISDEFAICGCHPVARGTPSRTSSSAAGHEGGPGTPFLRPRPKPAGGPARAVPELDGPGGSGWGDSTSPSPAHPHAVAEDGAAGRPGGVSRLV